MAGRARRPGRRGQLALAGGDAAAPVVEDVGGGLLNGDRRVPAGGGAEAAGSTPDALNAMMRADHKRWSEIIRTMKIVPEG